MTSTPLLKPFYRIVSALAVAAVAAIGQPATLSVADQLQADPADPGQQITPGDCVTATWSPADARLMTVPPGGSSPVSVAVASSVALKTDTVQYQVYNPGGGQGGSYSGWLPITDAKVVDSKTIIMTATVVPYAPVNNAFESIQFRVSPVVGSQFVCSPVHTIFAVTDRVRLPITIKDTAATTIAPVGYTNDTVCTAVPIWPGATYSSRLAAINNLFQITTYSTSTLTVTVGGFTTAGQIQLRRADGQCGTGTFYRDPSVDSSVFQSAPGPTRVLVVNNVAPGKSYLRVVSSDSIAPNTAFQMNLVFGPAQANVGPLEPNNTACTAYSIATNTNYSAYPEDSSDWYSFTLPTALNTQIIMTNFVVSGAGQYILYKSDNCAALGTALTVQDKSSGVYGPVALPAGKYFMRVAVGSGFQSTQLYTFRINTSAASAWSPTFERCAQLTGCGTDFTNNQITVYWSGTPNMNLLRMRLGARAAAGSCPTTNTIDPLTAGSTVYNSAGSWTVLGIPTGSYDMSIYTTSSLGEQHASPVFQVNVNCSAANTSWNPHFDICSQLTGCSSNFTNSRFTLYWSGTPNMNLLRMRLGGRAASGNCPASSTIDPINAPAAVYASTGSWENIGLPSGSYDMSIYTTSSSGDQHASPVFRVNINCTSLTGLDIQTSDGVAKDGVTRLAGTNAENINPYDTLTGEPLPTAIPEPTAIP